MTPNVSVRPQARDDIDDQAEYLMVNATTEIALRFLAAVDSTITLIARQPYMGVRSEYLRDPLMETRFQPVSGFQKHLIFYRPIENGIEVLRVIHGARDLHVVLGDDA